MDRYYLKSHEWITIENGIATVGISEHAQETLGDIAFIDFPTAGDTVEQGQEVAALESMKAASPIHAPLSGTISAVNSDLSNTPETINEKPFTDGWLFKISNFSEDQLSNLLSETEYKNYL